MTQDTETRLLGQVGQFLPYALARTIAAYREVITRAEKGQEECKKEEKEKKEEDLKDTKTRHEICKILTTHIELLLKLAARIGLQARQDRAQEDTGLLIEAARAELADWQEEACAESDIDNYENDG